MTWFHKFEIVFSLVMLVVLIAMLYVRVTKSGDKKPIPDAFWINWSSPLVLSLMTIADRTGFYRAHPPLFWSVIGIYAAFMIRFWWRRLWSKDIVEEPVISLPR